MSRARISRAAYTSVRLTIDLDGTLDECRSRYETAVPKLPVDRVAELIHRNGSWGEMMELIVDAAPNGFLIYASNFVDPVMKPAGNLGSCLTYSMGNHTIAERMFRFDPSVMLYAPLRTALWSGSDQAPHFTFDRPSDQFSSFSHEGIRAVGFELNRKFAKLLEHLGWEVPSELLESDPE